MASRRSGTLRIVGGNFRSRLVDFDPGTGVRPTPDRVRQTLFDWLSPVIVGARCLDLFAGSGALGLEALSRGAAHVTFVETGASQRAAIAAAVAKLGVAEQAEVRGDDALRFLATPVGPMGPSHRAHLRPLPAYDIVFVDPPFGAGLLAPVLAALPPVLAPDNRVYVEWPAAAPPAWPPAFAVLREKKAGQVSYALATARGISSP